MANNRILSNVEKDFMRSAFQLGLRMDGRKLRTVREMKIAFGAKTGSVEVSLGKTRVLARVCHELGAPRQDKPNQGDITINCTFPKYYHDSISSDDIDRICLIIKAGIYESKAIDLESLCILNGEKVWRLSCDISVNQHDGNIIDCANLATLCALKHHRRPDVTVVGSKIAVHSMLDRHPVALSIHHLPICVTLGHVLHSKDAFYTFNDPSIDEEKLMDGRTVYCMTRHNALCAVDKVGGVAMDAKDFLKFIDQNVMNIVKKWSNQIENKFIQYQYQSNDALTRKNKLNEKMEDAIDVFGYGLLNEKKMDVQMDGGDGGDGEVEVKDDDDMWMEWENEEKIKMETIRSNLELKSTVKRISATKSVLTSEFK